MTTIKPCRLCPLRENCQQRDEFRARVRDLGSAARSVEFRCPVLSAEVRKGRRIIISQAYSGYVDDYYSCEPTEVTCGAGRREIPATITFVWPDYSFQCTADKDAFEAIWSDEMPETLEKWMPKRFRRRQKHHRIVRFLDEPDRPITECGNVGVKGACDSRTGACECQRQDEEIARWV